VALAGRLLGIPTVIVMPADAPAVKVAATRGYGAEVVFYDRASGQDRDQIARGIAEKKGATLIPPFDHAAIIAGQGTATKELLEDVGPLDDLFVCCGGAGLLSGSAIAARHLSPGIRVIGVEPAAGDDVARSFRSGTLQRVANPQTIADGARTESAGAITFPLVMKHVQDVITVTDAQLVEAMRFLWERMKLVVEPTGALATAGVMSGADRRAQPPRGHHPFRRQRRSQGRVRALRVTALPHVGVSVPRRGSAPARALGRWLLSLMGWRVTGEVPDLPKFVAAVAPHTSNWDFLVGVATMFALDLRITFIGKHTLFRWPIGGVMRWLGGVPVDRSASHGVVGDTVSAMASAPQSVVAIAPQGTRSPVARFRSGFLHIARGASVPVVLVTLDYEARLREVRPDVHAGRRRRRGPRPRRGVLREREGEEEPMMVPGCTKAFHREQRRLMEAGSKSLN
jgi:1-acyl-sn-glycerol-3-phosphate acyltransferase/cysteine synthase